MARIWAEVLEGQVIGADDDFFAIGGDSIRSIQVAARCQRAGMAVKPYQIFQHRTISALAAVLSTGSSDGNPDSGEPDVPLVSDEHLKLAFGLVRFDQD